MLTTKIAPSTNHLLASLPKKDRQHLLANCGEPVELVLGTILSEPGEPIRRVYFPTTSYISLVTQIDEHAKMEVELVGNEGMFGTPLVLGVGVSSMHSLVQGGGLAWQIDAHEFLVKLEQSSALRQVLERYIYVLMSQLAQMAVCTRFHVAEERLARWLLMTGDRAHSSEFHLTHEFLAYMLGVRRVGITKAAGSLQKQKFISYSRGDITIIDRGGLEAASCGCYQADKEIYDRILAAKKVSTLKEVGFWVQATTA